MTQLGLPQLGPGSGTFERATLWRTRRRMAKAGQSLLASTLVLLTGIHACHANPEARPIPLATASSAPAQPISSVQQSLKHFPLVEMLKPVPPGMKRRDIDPMELILGPDSRTRARDLGTLQPVERGASCEELYNRVTVLLDQSVRTRPGIFDDPATSLFAAIGAVAPPAYLLVGVSAVAKLAEERHAQTVDQRIEMLRRRMADKRCYLD